MTREKSSSSGFAPLRRKVVDARPVLDISKFPHPT